MVVQPISQNNQDLPSVSLNITRIAAATLQLHEFDLTLSVAEHPAEDRVHMLGVIAKIEQGGDFSLTQMADHVGVALQQIEEASGTVPNLHGVSLHKVIGVLAADPRLGERQQHALGEYQAAQLVEIALDRFRINHQIGDHTGQPGQGEIEGDGRIWRDHPFHR